MASYLVNVNIRCQYEVCGLFGQPSFWLSVFNGKKVTNIPLVRTFITLYVSVYWTCLMTGFDLWWVKQNAELLNLQCRTRCAVRTFNSLHAASLGIQYGRKRVYDYSKFKTFTPSAVFVIYNPGYWGVNIYSSSQCSQAINNDRVCSKFSVSETRSVCNISNWQFLTTSTPAMGTEQVSMSLNFDRPVKRW